MNFRTIIKLVNSLLHITCLIVVFTSPEGCAVSSGRMAHFRDIQVCREVTKIKILLSRCLDTGSIHAQRDHLGELLQGIAEQFFELMKSMPPPPLLFRLKCNSRLLKSHMRLREIGPITISSRVRDTISCFFLPHAVGANSLHLRHETTTRVTA